MSKITEIELKYRPDIEIADRWRCEVFGYWNSGLGSQRNWGIGSGRWAWLAFFLARRNWWGSICERKKYLRERFQEANNSAHRSEG